MGSVGNNKNLQAAKDKKDDEFYTRYEDVENELKHYKEHLKGQIIYCNCDDYRISNFYKYFKDNFKELEIKELHSTNYNIGNGSFHCKFDGENEIVKEIKDGSYDSEYCLKILETSDIVASNPPFSLFRDYIEIVKNKKFIVVANALAYSYQNIKKEFLEGKIFRGVIKAPMKFIYKDGLKSVNAAFYSNIGKYIDKSGIPFSDIPIEEFKYYEDFTDTIEVPKLKMFPDNYYGKAGVPVNYLVKHDSKQFEIVDFYGSPLLDGKRKFKRIVIKRIK